MEKWVMGWQGRGEGARGGGGEGEVRMREKAVGVVERMRM